MDEIFDSTFSSLLLLPPFNQGAKELFILPQLA